MKTKFFHKLQCLILAAVMVLGLFPGLAHAAEPELPIDAAHFPDPVFLNYVLQRIDRDNSKTLSQEEIQATKKIVLYNCGLNDATGIEYFTALEFFSCASNNLTKLDVSKNLELQELIATQNKITYLDVRNNKKLTVLQMGENNLLALEAGDVSRFTSLIVYSQNSYPVTGRSVRAADLPAPLDMNKVRISSGGNLDRENGVFTFYPDTTKMTYIYDLGQKGQYVACFLETSTQPTNPPDPTDPVEPAGIPIDKKHFPDDTFRSFVLSMYDKNSTQNLEEFESSRVKIMNVSARNIKDLTGIEYFTQLEKLYCYDNQLTKLDLSKNRALKKLTAFGNQLTSIDVSANKALEELDMDGNPLTEINLSQNPALTRLTLAKTKLTKLDVSKNGNLEQLSCYNSQLTKLDISKNRALKKLTAFGNQLTSIDVSANKALEELDVSDNPLTKIDVSRNPALTTLVLFKTKLTKLDVSKNVNLEKLFCYDNGLTELDVTNNTKLVTINCVNNHLTSLDLSHNPLLQTVMAGNHHYKVNTRKVKVSEFPGHFDPSKVKFTIGGTFVDGVFEFKEGSNNIIYGYDVGCGLEEPTPFNLDYCSEEAPVENPFVDVQEGKYYYKPVLWAVKNNITKGTDKTHFSPNQTCTRGQIVTFLWNAANRPEPKNTNNPFVDVSPKNYYYKAVLWAVENNITKGTDKTHFSPHQTCTRGQVAAFLWSAHGRKTPVNMNNPFVDVSPKNYYYKAVLWAVENNITKGTDKTHFSPNQTCTRGQIAAFLWSAAGRPPVGA